MSLVHWLRAPREEVEVSASFLLEIYLLIQGEAALGLAQIIRLGPDPVWPDRVCLSPGGHGRLSHIIDPERIRIL